VSLSRELADQLQDRVTILEHSATGAPAPAPPGEVDPCSGLPQRAAAEAGLRAALASDAPMCAAIFYLHRMALINARFGEAIGNQVIQACGLHIAANTIKANDRLFRWSGPAFLAILHRGDSPLAVSSEIQRIVCSPLSRFFETPSRSVYLPMKITGEVIPLQRRTYAEVVDQIERFILSASGAAQQD
jgi:GGDEF domain-containing protein